MDPYDSLRTPGQIARDLSVPLHRVQYAILSRGIKPSSRAGMLRLFGPDAVEQIAEAIRTRKGAARGSN